MADPAGIEALQEQAHREALQQTREQGLRQALGRYDLTLDVTTMPYRDVLVRMQDVCGEELARLDNPEPAA